MGTFELLMGDNVWIFALSVALGLALVLTIVLKGGVLHFLSFLMITMAFMVYGGLLDTWYFVIVFILFITFVVLKYRGKVGDI